MVSDEEIERVLAIIRGLDFNQPITADMREITVE